MHAFNSTIFVVMVNICKNHFINIKTNLVVIRQAVHWPKCFIVCLEFGVKTSNFHRWIKFWHLHWLHLHHILVLNWANQSFNGKMTVITRQWTPKNWRESKYASKFTILAKEFMILFNYCNILATYQIEAQRIRFWIVQSDNSSSIYQPKPIWIGHGPICSH